MSLKLAWCTPVPNTDGFVGYARINKEMSRVLKGYLVDWLDTDWDWRVFMSTPMQWAVEWPGDYAPDVCFHTMYDCDLLPDRWARIIDRAGLVWVPSEWCREVFINSGVRRPIIVSGYGVDCDVFGFQKRSGPITFMTATQVNYDRKNWMMVAKAFSKLNLKDARLIIKTIYDMRQQFANPSISYVNEVLSDANWAQLMGRVDCFVYASSGEGFGLMPLEAMATGACVIATDYSGMTEYLDEDNLRLRFKLVDAELYNRGNGSEGRWAEPDFDDLCDKIRWVYQNRELALAMGRHASERVRLNWTWEHAGEKAKALLTGARRLG